jgi:TetR/AcrR family transcriptional regulator, regulator of cefoperazone and chloramphenicol sensitivity
MTSKPRASDPLAFEPKQATDPRQRLVLTAIAQIEHRGLSRVTVREIASAAGMNIASVNYYFRSKEALIQSALEQSLRHLLEDTELYLGRLQGDPLGALTDLLTYLLEGAGRYPKTMRAHLHDAFNEDDYGGPLPRAFASLLSSLRDGIRGAVPGLKPAQAGRRAVAAVAAILFPAVFPGLVASVGGLRTAVGRREYAEWVARQALAR